MITSIPSIPGITDLVRLQEAVALMLLSDERLATVPIIPELRTLMDNDVTVDALWTLPRAAIQVKPGGIELLPATADSDSKFAMAGPVGAGLLVEMPTGSPLPGNNVTGPPLRWQISVIAMEERNTNMLAGTGQLMMAEQLVQVALNCLHLQYVYPFGTLRATNNALTPAKDWEQLKPGIVCWRCSVDVENGRIQTARSQNVAISFALGACTLWCQDPAAHVIYTLDGSPAVRANPSALNYAGPFAVDPGTVVVAASWSEGKLASSISGLTAP